MIYFDLFWICFIHFWLNLTYFRLKFLLNDQNCWQKCKNPSRLIGVLITQNCLNIINYTINNSLSGHSRGGSDSGQLVCPLFGTQLLLSLTTFQLYVVFFLINYNCNHENHANKSFLNQIKSNKFIENINCTHWSTRGCDYD